MFSGLPRVSIADAGSSVVERNPPLVSVILDKSYSTKEANLVDAGRRGASLECSPYPGFEVLDAEGFRGSRRD